MVVCIVFCYVIPYDIHMHVVYLAVCRWNCCRPLQNTVRRKALHVVWGFGFRVQREGESQGAKKLILLPKPLVEQWNLKFVFRLLLRFYATAG